MKTFALKKHYLIFKRLEGILRLTKQIVDVNSSTMLCVCAPTMH